MEHLLTQNKELLSHLQKLMSQLAQIQALQQSLSIQQDTPTAMPTAQSSTSDSQQAGLRTASPAGDPASKPTSPPSAESPLPAMTSTPTKQQQPSTADGAVSSSEMSLGLDFNILSGSPTNDPFQPHAQPASS